MRRKRLSFIDRLLGRKSLSTGDSNWFFLPGGNALGSIEKPEQNSIVRACIRWACMAVPEAKLVVVDEDDVIINNAVAELLANPNDIYGDNTLTAGIVTSLLLNGNAYVLHDNGLWYVPHTQVTPVRDSRNVITSYDIRSKGITVRVERTALIHFRLGIDVNNPDMGMGPVSGVLREVMSDEEAARYTHALLRNMGVPGVIVSPKSDSQTMSDEQAERLKDLFRARFTGERRGEPLVFSGPMDITPVGFGPQQLSVDVMRRVPEERISAALGIPAIVVGFGAGLQRSTFANFAEAREAAYESFVLPMAQLIASEYTRYFRAVGKLQRTMSVKPDVSNIRILQPDIDALAQRMNIGVQGGWIRVSEARTALGLPVTPEDEVYLRPMTVVPTFGSKEYMDAALDLGMETELRRRRKLARSMGTSRNDNGRGH